LTVAYVEQQLEDWGNCLRGKNGRVLENQHGKFLIFYSIRNEPILKRPATINELLPKNMSGINCVMKSKY